MSARAVTEHVHWLSLGMVNVFLIVLPDGLTLVDAGYQRSWPRIERAIRGLGRRPEEVGDILVTHLHADHTGGLAQAQAVTGARVWMHPEDAALVRAGEAARPVHPSPGKLTGVVVAPFASGWARGGHVYIPPVRVICEINDGQTIPAAGGITAVETPGHTRGHLVYLWPQDDGVLFVGDAAARITRLQASPIYEDFQQGQESLRRISALEFETACFGHGRPLVGGAQAAFQRAWPGHSFSE